MSLAHTKEPGWAGHFAETGKIEYTRVLSHSEQLKSTPIKYTQSFIIEVYTNIMRDW